MLTRNNFRLNPIKMKKYILRLNIGSLLVVFLNFYSGLAQERSSFVVNAKKVDIAQFEDRLGQMMEQLGVPGMSLAIIDDGKIVFYKGLGLKELNSSKEVDQRTIFEACSLSKSFLVMVAHQLVDEGRLDLDLPVFRYMEHEKLEYDQRYKQITTRMLLSHSSGMENWIFNNKRDKLELLANPGERYVYSGEGYQYLAMVIEKLLDQPYRRIYSRKGY